MTKKKENADCPPEVDRLAIIESHLSRHPTLRRDDLEWLVVEVRKLRAELERSHVVAEPMVISGLTHARCHCGHEKIQHIYGDGACRPGFVCDCPEYNSEENVGV